MHRSLHASWFPTSMSLVCNQPQHILQSSWHYHLAYICYIQKTKSHCKTGTMASYTPPLNRLCFGAKFQLDQYALSPTWTKMQQKTAIFTKFSSSRLLYPPLQHWLLNVAQTTRLAMYCTMPILEYKHPTWIRPCGAFIFQIWKKFSFGAPKPHPCTYNRNLAWRTQQLHTKFHPSVQHVASLGQKTSKSPRVT